MKKSDTTDRIDPKRTPVIHVPLGACVKQRVLHKINRSITRTSLVRFMGI